MSTPISNTQIETKKKINHALFSIAKQYEKDRAEYDYPWIVFAIENKNYAINARYVLRVDILHEIVPYTLTQDYYPGVIWDRDGMIPLLDVRVLLGHGDYLSKAKSVKGLPMIIVIDPSGERRGMIVDKIVAMEYSGAPVQTSVKSIPQLSYVQGTVIYDPLHPPAYVINPKGFDTLVFDGQNRKIDWKKRIDLNLSVENRLKN